MGGVFSSQEDALSKNPDNPEAPLFSILDNLESYRTSDGLFHFKLCYPEINGDTGHGGQCNEWKQSSNPATEATIKDFQAVWLGFSKNSLNEGWAGLGKSSDQTPRSLMDDAPTHSHWHTAIGATHYHWPPQFSTNPVEQSPMSDLYIPGPNVPGSNWLLQERVTKVELYAYKEA